MALKDKKVVRYFYEAKEELEKVVWLSRNETLKATLIVVGVSVGTALVLGALDYGLTLALQTLVK